MVATDFQNAILQAVGGELCLRCTNLPWKPSPTARMSSRKQIYDSPGLYHHHSSWRDLQHSAEHCPLCRMIEHEILQSYAFRSLNGAQVQILGEDLVRNRGALKITRGTGYDGREIGISSPIFLQTVAKASRNSTSHIQILLPDWIEADAVDRARDKASYTDWREEWKRTSGRGDTPRLDVFTSIGGAVSDRLKTMTPDKQQMTPLQIAV